MSAGAEHLSDALPVTEVKMFFLPCRPLRE